MLEPPAQTTGAHRALRRARPALGQTPSARYEPHLDGLFTYCLSVLCDHGAATAVLGEVLAVAERHHGRGPADEERRKAWLYALARWACLRALGEQRRRRHQGPGAHAARPGAHARGAAAPEDQGEPLVPPETEERHRAELARLAWPEAAGTTPEQREALELAVRHGLGSRDVAAVLGMEPASARELLSSAACEVERTRAALAVVETGNCPSVARLTADRRVLLSAALRRELVRHVDDCPRCRRSAERAGASGPWPGSTVTPAALPLVAAPRAEAHAALPHLPRARAAAPRFGRDGFPLDPKDHAARRSRLRARAVTTTVVATVVAAPVLALWAAYRGAPLTGEAREDSSVSASEADAAQPVGGVPYDRYENAGNARRDAADSLVAGGLPRPGAGGVTVEVISPGLPPGSAGADGQGFGRLSVEARPYGGSTMLTLTASGGAPVSWSLWTDVPWLYADRVSGTLAPGRSVVVRVHVDHAAEPAGPWSARVGVDPAGTVLQIRGEGAPQTSPSSEPPPSEPPSSEPSSSEPPPSSSEPPPSEPPSSATGPSPPPLSEAPATPG
ncbi:sigma-70 family RNA polymerase sigma factor [Streptomyces marianii]|uniref:Sigma-70 family RNA polymerase sigma factor n=1 Tax=Streptomyces marianii TaxID=1817406 RepID=A0A5R9EII1_9ACTN|nr:sigma-70 family RNA polymerase sigma factor [Streptomyces marianii]TLQ48252.1 sigma-70 family RNA polymerase sigma factor [Streptomyces marianii]